MAGRRPILPWLLALGDSGPRKLAGGFDLQIPLWSPRGEALALRRYGSQGVPELVLVSRDGAVTSLVPGAGALDLFPAAFSPDGRFIYYVKLTAQGSELGRAPVGGGNVTTIMGSLGTGLSRDWRLSPPDRAPPPLPPRLPRRPPPGDENRCGVHRLGPLRCTGQLCVGPAWGPH